MKTSWLRMGCVVALVALTACGGDSSSGDNTNGNANDNANDNNDNVLCGNGVIDPGEDCDGSAVGGETCVSLGQDFVSGTLACDGSCGFDTSGCVAPYCGDGVVDATAGEECDNATANSDTEPDACRTDCLLPWCGDGIIDPANSEDCDGLAMGGADCTTLGYPGGTLVCAATCEYDESSCTPVGTCTQNAECTAVDYCERAVGDCNGVGQCTTMPTICSSVWDPVCGCDGATYGNPCEAAAAGMNVDYLGECLIAGCSTNADCPAAADYCVKAVGDCNGVGQCTTMPTICPSVWDPVCGCDGATYGNPCEAAAAGMNVDYLGEC